MLVNNLQTRLQKVKVTHRFVYRVYCIYTPSPSKEKFILDAKISFKAFKTRLKTL